jgi:hypothetical protein
MRAFVFAAVVVTLGIAVPAASSEPAAAQRSGLYGHATKGPLTPVCSVSIPCYGPATSSRIGFARHGHATRWTRTDQNGDYRITLPAGRYRIKSKIGFGVAKPGFVRVSARRYVRADLMLDTGIR